MSYKYSYEGSNGGYPLEEIKEPEESTICDLCGEPCENLHLEPITSTLSIIVCQECYNGDPVEYQSILDYKTLNI